MNEKEMLEHRFQTLRQVVRAVTGSDPLEDSRKRPIVDARRIFCQLVYDQRELYTWENTLGKRLGKFPRKSYITTISIGKFLGRAHCSIVHLLNTTPALLQSEPELKTLYNEVYAKFGKDIYKRLRFTEISIAQKEKELEYLYTLREELVNLKNAKHEKNSLPKQGVLFEVPINDKGIENV